MRAGARLGGQVVAGALAILAAGALGDAVLRPNPPPRTFTAPASFAYDPGSSTHRMIGAEGGLRARPRYPVEFEAQLGPVSLRSFDTFASADWRVPTGPVEATFAPARARIASAARPSAHRTTVAALPPARPLPMTLPTPIGPTVMASAATPAEEPLRVLGVALPGYATRAGGAVVRSVASLGGAFVDLVPRFN